MSEFLRQCVHLLRDRAVLGLAALAWGACVLSGPFGTYPAMTPHLRGLFWAVPILVAVPVWALLRALAASGLLRVADSGLVALTAVAQALVLAPLMPPVGARLAGFDLSPVQVAGHVIAVSLAVQVAWRGFAGAGTGDARLSRDAGVRAVPALYRRLPEAHDGALLRLSAQDHFVQVVTTKARFRVRMRLSDAIAEAAGVAGHATHRSHWVAQAAVAGVRRCGGREVLVLTDGSEVPVSRTYRAALVAAGVL